MSRALRQLNSFSLISYDGKDESFSLHPLVRAWARDRLSKGEQALWVHVAVNTIVESILLPPCDIGEAHQDFRRDILPHLDECLKASPVHILDYKVYFGGYKAPSRNLLSIPHFGFVPRSGHKSCQVRICLH